MAPADAPIATTPRTRVVLAHLKDASGRLRRWLFRLRPEAGRPAGPPEPRERFRNVCISHEAGSGGGKLARMLGGRLGWEVHDEELIAAIALGMKVSVEE